MPGRDPGPKMMPGQGESSNMTGDGTLAQQAVTGAMTYSTENRVMDLILGWVSNVLMMMPWKSAT